MKKFSFILTIFITLFMFNSKVYADGYVNYFEQPTITTATMDGKWYPNELTSVVLQNRNYYRLTTDKTIAYFDIQYVNFPKDGNYDLSFFIRQYGSFVQPLIIVNNVTCSTKNIVTEETHIDSHTEDYLTHYQQIYSYDSTFSVTCENVSITDKKINLRSYISNNNSNKYFNFWITHAIGYRLNDKSALTNEQKETNKKLDETNKNIKDTNDTLKDDNVDDSTSTASSFFGNFSTSDNGGLSSIISSPLSFINQLSSSTCTPLILNVPFVDEEFTLPCMSLIYEEKFGSFYSIFKIIITGFIGYWVVVKLYALVKGFKDPENDRIEVLEL